VERLQAQVRPGLPADRCLTHNVGVGTESDYLIPDLTVTTWAALGKGALLLAPTDIDLVVEVLSPSARTHDLATKMTKHAAFGLERWWILDPDLAMLTDVLLQAGTTTCYQRETVTLEVAGWAATLALNSVF
jgi:Uma2 family endonuclease